MSEFERTPVPAKSLLGFRSFLGQYAGEHTAGTELMIGPLFVAAGVGAFDLVVGLFIGNALAVLSWLFLTTPIATKARLTLYYQLEKIAGRKLVTLYNLANGIMFCFLAGAMITVSATAIGVWFNFKMPGLNDLYPNSLGWVLAVLAVGAVISFVAAFGYKTLSRFANWAAPFMIIAFIGGDPLPGQVKFTLWHVIFFSWFCNMAMHIGMSDLSVFRFAKKNWYAVSTGAGMYLGHFIAWISAAILYALQLHLDPTNTDVLPGPMAYKAIGVFGILLVIVAGWTTANPTIYRAGLAFQALVPKRSRFTVTLITGGLATMAGLFPAIAMKLLDFVAIYGMILMPMGAVIFMDFWVFPKLGLKQWWAEVSGARFNWSAGLAWFLTLVTCVLLVKLGGIQLFFVSLPGWFVAAGIYLLSAKVIQSKTP